MNMKKLVSVLVNCRNGEKYLKEAIDSILNQSYSNLEIIFFDNNSNDKSLEIIKSYNDQRINIYRSKSLIPLYEARNRALNFCKGEFISFLDVDDFWHNDFLKKRESFFKQENKMFSYSNWNFLFEKKNKIIHSREKLFSGMIFDDLSKNYVVKISSLIINKKIFQLIKEKFDPKYNIIGDFDFVMKMALRFEAESIDENLVTIRIHKNNFSNLNRDLHYKEYQDWYLNLNLQNIKIKKNLKYFKEKLSYLKTIYLLISGNKLKGMSEIFNYPNNLKKIKLLMIFIIPNFLIKKLLEK